jgi:hypothetical protein
MCPPEFGVEIVEQAIRLVAPEPGVARRTSLQRPTVSV